jgi:glycosyltransferase involved in cell wall biosynthesis
VENAAEKIEERPRNRFGYFGQLNRFKGISVLLEALISLGPNFDGHLWIHGANLELAAPGVRHQFVALRKKAEGAATLAGEYDRADLGQLMANIDWVVVPSIWWENSPVVIQEAYQYGRPVICSDIGGMAEKVADGVSGLHFRRGDVASLAKVMRRAAKTSGLWEKLRSGIPSVYAMEDHVASLRMLYEGLLTERRRSLQGGAPSRETVERV